MNSELLGHVRSVVNAIPFEQFSANSILREKIENDELYRLDCVSRPYTDVLINQMKQEDGEITSLRSAARLMRSKTKIPIPRNIKPLMLGPILTSEIIASAEITLISKKRKIRTEVNILN